MKTINEAVMISDERLGRLVKTLTQVKTKRSGRIVEVRPVDPRRKSCIWDMKFGKERSDLRKGDALRTVHLCGHYSIFKPSIAEVLAQVPEDGEERIVAFEILDDVSILEDGSGHEVTTQFYVKRN